MLSKTKKILTAQLLALAIVLPFLLLGRSSVNVIHPLDTHDIPKVSAMILMKDDMGSSTIVQSGPNGSDFLTNDHVCQGALKSGGFMILQHRRYEISAIKESERSDLCLVRVQENLNLATEVSDKAPSLGDPVMGGGYPLDQPLLIQRGYVSERFNFSDDPRQPLFGLLTSLLVQPGSSGTGVFDADGKLVAVLEAFRSDNPNSEIGFGIAVPYRETLQFMKHEQYQLRWVPVPHVPRS